MQHTHGNLPYMFDCWADPFAHLLPLKSSMDWLLSLLKLMLAGGDDVDAVVYYSDYRYCRCQLFPTFKWLLLSALK